MKSIPSLVLLSFICSATLAQDYSSSSIFAHNDYVRAKPFYTAYNLQVGYIEADVFLKNDELLVAHTKLEVNKSKTLDKLYLEPLKTRIVANGGMAYAVKEKKLTLMIDLKTEGVATLNLLVEKLKKFPELIACSTLTIMISGNVPDPALWKNYPEYIHFDGRPNIDYSQYQLDRIAMISTNFNSVSNWNGKEGLPAEEKAKILAVVSAVHSHHKPVRFWATPDFENAWKQLMELKLDVIVTDDVQHLSDYISKQ